MVFSNVLAVQSDNVYYKLTDEQFDSDRSSSHATDISYQCASFLLKKCKAPELFAFMSLSKEYSLKPSINIQHQLQSTRSHGVFNFCQMHLAKSHTPHLASEYLA